MEYISSIHWQLQHFFFSPRPQLSITFRYVVCVCQGGLDQAKNGMKLTTNIYSHLAGKITIFTLSTDFFLHLCVSFDIDFLFSPFRLIFCTSSPFSHSLARYFRPLKVCFYLYRLFFIFFWDDSMMTASRRRLAFERGIWKIYCWNISQPRFVQTRIFHISPTSTYNIFFGFDIPACKRW